MKRRALGLVAVILALVAALLFLGGDHNRPQPRHCPHHKTCHRYKGIVPSPFVPPGGLAVPVNTAVPTIAGSLQQGLTLTESHGTWTNTPTGYVYQWEDCNLSGAACTAITSGSSCSATPFTCTQTYVLQSTDVGFTIRVQEIASNASGSGATATSAATTMVTPNAAPANTAVPTISGTAQVGQVLTENAATWNNCQNGVCTFAYQWKRCSPGCVNVAAATAQAYTVVVADVGDTLEVVETATNAIGSASATSAQTATVTSPPAGLGTGASKATCSPSPCLAILTTNGGWDFGSQTVSGTVPNASVAGTPFTFDDGTHYDSGAPAHNITSYMWIGIPPHLITNDATHPVPLVITFPDGCTGSSFSRNSANTGCLDVCNTGTCTSVSDNGNQGWSQVCATEKCIVVSLFAWASAFNYPTFRGANLNTCGSSGTLPCDQVAEVVAAISYMEAHYAIDPNMIFANGGSKGGSMAMAASCDARSEPLLAGVTPMSVVGPPASGTTVTTVPFNNVLGTMSCGMFINGGPLPTNPNTSVHPLMWQGLWSASDVQATCTGSETWDGVSNTSCQNGGVANSAWQYSWPDKATYIIGPAFGCLTSSPTIGHEGTDIVTRTFSGCASNTANATTVQTIDYPAPSCHAWGCDGAQGGNQYVATTAWNFWTTGTTTP